MDVKQETYNLKVTVFHPEVVHRHAAYVEAFFYLNDLNDPWVTHELDRARDEAKSLRRFMRTCKIDGQVSIVQVIEHH